MIFTVNSIKEGDCLVGGISEPVDLRKMRECGSIRFG
jgi:hypothetical protein